MFDQSKYVQQQQKKQNFIVISIIYLKRKQEIKVN